MLFWTIVFEELIWPDDFIRVSVHLLLLLTLKLAKKWYIWWMQNIQLHYFSNSWQHIWKPCMALSETILRENWGQCLLPVSRQADYLHSSILCCIMMCFSIVLCGTDQETELSDNQFKRINRKLTCYVLVFFYIRKRFLAVPTSLAIIVINIYPGLEFVNRISSFCSISPGLSSMSIPV